VETALIGNPDSNNVRDEPPIANRPEDRATRHLNANCPGIARLFWL